MSANTLPPAPYVDTPLAPEFRARFAGWMMKLVGWRVVLAQPVPLRCVVVFYPHTSNWDFPLGLMAKWLVGVHFRFIAKDSLFATPLGPWLRRWGGIPVDRSGGTGVIARLAAAIRATRRLQARRRAGGNAQAHRTLEERLLSPGARGAMCRWRWRSSTIGGAKSAWAVYLELTGDIDG